MPPRSRSGRRTSSRSRNYNRSTSRANRGAASRRARSAARARSRASAARRRDAARPSVRAAARRSSSSRGNRGAASRTARAAARSRSASRAASRRDAARPSVVRSRQRTALSRSAGERGRGASTSQSQGRSAAAANQARQRARSLGSRRRAAAAAARRRDANRPSVRRARTAAANRMMSANQTPARTSTASLSERRNAASAKLARQRAQTLAADRRRRQRQASGQADQRRRASASAAARNAAANKQAAQSLLSAGYRNVKGDKNKSTLGQQFMSGIRNLMRGETGFVFPGSGKSGTAVPPQPRTSCPTPDMRILMADGSLKVAGDLQVGDIVRTAHENTLEWGDHKVTHKDIVEDEVVSLKFENSSIKCSPTHKVYLSNDSKWVEVQDLKEGDVVKTEDSYDTFVSLEKIDSGEVVVLTVEGAHTYIAEGILSHNKRPRPPEIVDPFRPIIEEEEEEEELPLLPVRPRFPQYPGMYGGIGAFGYNPALMAFESQQGAGQVPYYMAAARNAQTPNMSPAFMHAARNYDILGGMQRTAPRPMEMMSAAERAQIAGMSNFSTPNYNSPYDQFNFFSNMVGGGGGKGMGRPMPQMGSGLGAFYGGFA